MSHSVSLLLLLFALCTTVQGFRSLPFTPEETDIILKEHNNVRQSVSPPAADTLSNLQWSNQLVATAQSYAEECQFGRSGQPYGENIAVGSLTATYLVKLWSDESLNYDYNTGQCHQAFSDECSHYTQIVWSDTQYLGCGRAACQFSFHQEPLIHTVCQYQPAGNIDDRRPYVDIGSNKTDPCSLILCIPHNDCQEQGICSEGNCTFPISVDGKWCNDKNWKTKDDKCINGTCVGTIDPNIDDTKGGDSINAGTISGIVIGIILIVVIVVIGSIVVVRQPEEWSWNKFLHNFRRRMSGSESGLV